MNGLRIPLATYFAQRESDYGRTGPTFDGGASYDGPTDSNGVPIPVGEARVELSDNAGRYTRTTSMTINREAMREPGYVRAPSAPSPTWQRGYDTARFMLESALTGNRRAMLNLQEAMTVSDFGLYFGDVLDRQVLANYQETSYTWDMWCKRAILNDFRLSRMFRVDRGAAVLDGPITANSYGATGDGTTGLESLSEYPLRRRVITGYTDQLYKFGCRMDYAFETIVNDDLDALKDTPALFGRAARRTEEKRATKLICTATGPDTTFFNTANKNVINSTVLSGYTGSPNPALSIEAIMNGLTVLASQRDLDGEPIAIEAAVLVYGPALKVTAENILNARELWVNSEGGVLSQFGSGATTTATSSVRMVVANWASGFARGALNYYLPVISSGNAAANTQWYLFASPSMGRPAVQLSFLRGREMPQMFMKLPNQVALGEGRMGPGAGVMPGTMNSNPMEGDFENDQIDYKVRHWLGGTKLDYVCAVASTGQNA